MLAFLRDYIIYLWNVLFKQTQPASGALTSAESRGSNNIVASDSSTSIQFPITSTDTRDKAEEQEAESPKFSTPVKIESSDTNLTVQKPIKPADLSYPTAQSEKQIPPEPSRPPPLLSESKSISKSVPAFEIRQPVPFPSEIKEAPLLENKAVSPPQAKSISHEERLSFPSKSAENKEFVTKDSECKFIPTSAKVEKVEAKQSPLVSTPPKVQEAVHKPQVVQEVRQEPFVTDDFEDEEEYNYGDEFEDEEIEEDIDSSDDPSEEKKKVNPSFVQPQKTSKPFKVREYDSEEDRSDNERSETSAVKLK